MPILCGSEEVKYFYFFRMNFYKFRNKKRFPANPWLFHFWNTEQFSCQHILVHRDFTSTNNLLSLGPSWSGRRHMPPALTLYLNQLWSGLWGSSLETPKYKEGHRTLGMKSQKQWYLLSCKDTLTSDRVYGQNIEWTVCSGPRHWNEIWLGFGKHYSYLWGIPVWM